MTAPTEIHQFQHHLSLLSSRSDTQRKESLAYLTTYVAARPASTPLPQPVGVLLDKACPLLLDASTGVRGQVLRLFQALQVDDFRDHVTKILPFIRAGMTHLSRDVRTTALDFLSWLLDADGQDIVACPGGWTKTLESFLTLLGWKPAENTNKWSSGKATFGSEVKSTARIMQVLAQLLHVGLDLKDNMGDLKHGSMIAEFPLWHVTAHEISKKSNVYSYLDLFGAQKTEESQILEDRGDRLNLFNERFLSAVLSGTEAARREGGELGRAAGLLTKAVAAASVEG